MIIYGLQTVKSFKVTFALKVTLTIYLFYNLCRFSLELSTNILIMIILSSFKVTSTIYLFYNLCRCILVLSYTKYKHINNDPSSFKVISTIYLFYIPFTFPLVVLTCTKYKDINNDPSSFKVIFTFYFTISTFLY